MADKKHKHVTNSGKIEWIIGSVIIIIIFLLAIVGLVRFFYGGSTNEIVGVANQFHPQPGWKLVAEQIEAPRSFCIDVECPSVQRTWEINHTITKDNVDNWSLMSGWKIQYEEGCFEQYPNGENANTCWAYGEKGKHKITIIADNGDRQKNPSITLSVTNKE